MRAAGLGTCAGGRLERGRGAAAQCSPLSNLGRAALAAYLKTLAGEVAADGVTVNMLLPGRIATDRVAALDRPRPPNGKAAASSEVRAESQHGSRLAGYGDPDEFGAVAAFLCSARRPTSPARAGPLRRRPARRHL